MEEKKKEDYYKKLQDLQIKKQELEKKIIIDEDIRQKKEIEREHKRQHLIENNQKILDSKIKLVNDKLTLTDIKVKNSKQKFQQDLLIHKTSKKLFKEVNFQENIGRMQDMDAYKRQKFLEKIEQNNQRIEQIRREEENLLQLKMKIKTEMDKKKETLIQQLSEKKHRNFIITRSKIFSNLKGIFYIFSLT